MLKSLDRVVCKVPDLNAAKEWYRSALNLEPVYDSPFAVLFKIGGSMLTLAPGNSGSYEGAVVYWETDDIAADYRSLIEAGCVSRTEIRASHNVRLASVADPFGNVIGLVSKDEPAERTSVENQPSETALVVASIRALAYHDGREEIRGRDHLAEIFLTEERKKPLRDPQIRAWIMENAMPKGMYEYLIARTAFFDQLVENALDADIPQIVFLGAGYDSRPYRFRDRIRSTRIFELDARLTQERKLDLLRKHQVAVPERIEFIPINFNTDHFGEVLVSRGYDRTAKTLFVWEGVSFYLSEEVIGRTLSIVAEFSPAGSRIGFDFQTYSPGDERRTRTKVPGESLKFAFEEGEIEEFLTRHGFGLEDHLRAAEMEARYLRLKDGSLVGNVEKGMNFALAAVR